MKPIKLIKIIDNSARISKELMAEAIEIIEKCEEK